MLVVQQHLKFNITNNKTYQPCDLSDINDVDLFLSFLIGFIDGDGCIKKQYKRNDSLITIKLHSSWLHNLYFIKNKLCNIFNITMSDPKINSYGYARLNICNSIILKNIKKFAIINNLPILTRKWDIILIG